MFRVIIAGSRTFTDYEKLEATMDELLRNQLPDVIVISGGAKGADELGERYAKAHDLNLIVYPARWREFGKAAGHIRNREMAGISRALVSFWDGQSPGTESMIEIAREKHLLVRVIDV